MVARLPEERSGDESGALIGRGNPRRGVKTRAGVPPSPLPVDQGPPLLPDPLTWLPPSLFSRTFVPHLRRRSVSANQRAAPRPVARQNMVMRTGRPPPLPLCSYHCEVRTGGGVWGRSGAGGGGRDAAPAWDPLR